MFCAVLPLSGNRLQYIIGQFVYCIIHYNTIFSIYFVYTNLLFKHFAGLTNKLLFISMQQQTVVKYGFISVYRHLYRFIQLVVLVYCVLWAVLYYCL